MATAIRPFHPDMGTDTITYTWVPTLEEYYRVYQPHGMEYGMQNMWGIVSTDDGQPYFFTREIGKEVSIFTFYNKVSGGMETPDEPMFAGKLFSGYILHHLDESEGTVTIAPQFKGDDYFSLTIKPQSFHFIDAGGSVDLNFEVLAASHTWYCPGKYGALDDSMYRSEHARITGTINGERVTGFGGMDSEWVPVGVGLREAKRYAVIEKYWLVWTTEYEDGTVEGGVYVRGLGNNATPYYYRNGEAFIPEKHHIEVKMRSNGLVEAATIYFDDKIFDFTGTSLSAEDVCAVSDGQNADEDQGEDAGWVGGYVVSRDASSAPVKMFAMQESIPKRVLREGFDDLR